MVVSCSEDDDAGFIADQALSNLHLPALRPSIAAPLDDHLGVNDLDNEHGPKGLHAHELRI